ncbi:MAG TPA: hypothetical protein VFY16_10005 [Gemmatimonadaceae bacterium]|nr:hypothetical protein [Gemmatimonadaceae bacterium]
MKQVLGVLAGLTLALAAAEPVQAQDMGGTRSVNFGLAGGLSVPVGDVADGFKSGYNIVGTVGWQPAARAWGLQFDLGYTNLAEDNGFSDDLSVLSGTGNVVLTVANNSGIKPYVIGGLGFYNMDAGGDSETEFGLNGGGGLTFPLGGISTYVEARFHSIFTEDSNSNYIPIVFGVRF